MKQTFILSNKEARRRAINAVATAPEGYAVEVKEQTRTLEQNRLLWPLLTEVSRQVVWYGRKLTPEEWKDVFTAALKREDIVPGIDGGFVVLGQRTSRYSKRKFSDLIEVIFAFGAQREPPVKFSTGRQDYE